MHAAQTDTQFRLHYAAFGADADAMDAILRLGSSNRSNATTIRSLVFGVLLVLCVCRAAQANPKYDDSQRYVDSFAVYPQ